VRFRERRNEALVAAVRPIRNAPEAVASIGGRLQGASPAAPAPTAGRWRCSSPGAGAAVVRGPDLQRPRDARSKPAPDVYLAAMGALGVRPERCAVVEDTVTGVTAGVAAGAMVFGYSPSEAGHDVPAVLRAAGASLTFADMADLPELVM